MKEMSFKIQQEEKLLYGFIGVKMVAFHSNGRVRGANLSLPLG